MQDGAPCHTTKASKKFLVDHNIPLLPWPGNSPDLNPIENIWSIVKRKMSKVRVTTRTQLIERLIEVWVHDGDIKFTAKNAIMNISKRIAEIFKAKGKRTKY